MDDLIFQNGIEIRKYCIDVSGESSDIERLLMHTEKRFGCILTRPNGDFRLSPEIEEAPSGRGYPELYISFLTKYHDRRIRKPGWYLTQEVPSTSWFGVDRPYTKVLSVDQWITACNRKFRPAGAGYVPRKKIQIKLV